MTTLPPPVHAPSQVGGGLCERCVHRTESIQRVRDFVTGGNTGMVCDPAPRAECKRHAGYGHEVMSRDTCTDFEGATCTSTDLARAADELEALLPAPADFTPLPPGVWPAELPDSSWWEWRSRGWPEGVRGMVARGGLLYRCGQGYSQNAMHGTDILTRVG